MKFKSQIIIPASYLAFFLLYFLPHPLNDSFMGNTDGIGHLAIFYDHYFNIKTYLIGTDIGNIMYPANGIVPYLESYLGESVIFFFFRMFGLNDIWSSYFMIVVLYSLNASAVYLLSYYYTSNRFAAFFAGFVFAASSYMLSNIELLNGLAFFCVPVSIYLLERFFDSPNWKWLAASLILIVVEFYFSGYHFLIGFGCLGLLTIFHFKQWKSIPFRPVAISLFIFLLALLPVGLVLTAPELSNAYNPLDDFSDGPARFSLSWYSLFKAMPNNLIYPSSFGEYSDQSLKMNYYANLGIVCWLMVFTAFFKKLPRRIYFVVLALFGLVISIGPYLMIGSHKITMPITWLYNFGLIERFIRIPGRFFVLTNFAIAILCGYGFAVIYHRLKKPAPLLVIVCSLFIIENVEFPQHINDHSQVTTYPLVYEQLPDYKQDLVVLAEFPSSIFSGSGYVNGVSEFSREYRYQYWQIRHKHNTVNGSASFFPHSRIENNRLLMNPEEGDNFEILIDSNHVDYLVFHKDLILVPSEEEIYTYLKSKPILEIVFENDRSALFKVKRN